MSLSRSIQYLFLAIIVTTVGFSLYQWNASRASTQKTAPNNGLVGYWSFDENTGTQAGDASGNGNTGTLTNGPTWTTGKLGKAINFDGTNDYVTMGDQASLEINNNSLSFGGWFYINAYPAANNRMFLITKGTTGSYEYELTVNEYNASSNKFTATLFTTTANTYITVVSNTVPPLNTWFHVMGVWDKDAVSMKLYYNGVLENTSTTTNGTIHTTRTANFEIGRRNDNAEKSLNGRADEVRIYNRALSGTEVTNLYNLGAEKLNISPTTSLTSGLVGYWTFDGKDTPWTSNSAGTATDRSGNGNTGTLTNMSRASSSVSGKLGQALNFDGVNDYITLSTLQTSGATTLSAWIYPNIVSGRQVIVGRLESGSSFPWNYGYGMLLNGSTLIGMSAYNDSSWANNLNATVQAGVWQHVVFTITGSSGTQTGSLYINGILVDSYSGTANPSIAYPYSIGCGLGNFAGSFFNGKIDDVRSYNRALSAGEIQSLYDLGASDKVNSSVSQNQGTGRLDSGLVGYWKLDDASGTTATDSGVRSINGTLTNGPTWGTGQIGGDVVFDGTNDYIATTGNTPFITLQLQPHSFFAWVYPLATSATQSIISYGQSDDNDWSSALGLRGASRTATWLGNGTNENSIAISTLNVPVNQWSFVGVVLNGTAQVTFYVNGQSSTITCTACGNVVTSDPFTIGATYYAANRGGFFSGSIDDARAYNRALSADEVSQLYRLTVPTGVDTSLKGYWSFDGSATNWTSSSAGTTSDLSGSGNTGTLTNMSRATSSVSGKLGQALNFDGSSQYVVASDASSLDITGTLTLSAWIYKTVHLAAGQKEEVVAKANQSAAESNYELATVSTAGKDKINFIYYNAGNQSIMGSTLLDLNTWYHLTAVYDDAANSIKLYVNGTLETNTVLFGSPETNSLIVNNQPLLIGQKDGTYNKFAGRIDDVRVYNRALSAGEIQSLYNSGR